MIDDAVGSGAMLNETAKQMRGARMVKGKIIGLSIVGSYKGFEVIMRCREVICFWQSNFFSIPSKPIARKAEPNVIDRLLREQIVRESSTSDSGSGIIATPKSIDSFVRHL